MINYLVRSAKKKDMQRVLDIRNHPAVLSQSQSPAVALADHIAWFPKQYFSGWGNLCFVLEESEKVLGYCRFDLDKAGNYRVSIAIHPSHHSRGLGSFLLSGSLKQLPKDKTVFAVIKKENIPSYRLFLKSQFRPDREDEQNYYLKYDVK